jgi:endonuclease YncB( thermonuclease family)
MPSAIRQSAKGFTVGTMGLGLRRGAQGTVEKEVHDGDTVIVRAVDNFGVRFLGIDAPEESFPLPGTKLPFVKISDARWEQALVDPFTPAWDTPLEPALQQDIEARLQGGGAAANHAELADKALVTLTDEVSADQHALAKTDEDFRFFLAFAYDVVDRYGRLLCYLHPDLPKDAPKQPSYNERLLAAARVIPYFIWPNVDPFVHFAFAKTGSIQDAVPKPDEVQKLVEKSPKLEGARDAVKSARQSGKGLFNHANPLRIFPFELRFISRRKPPDRWVIDLTSDAGVLLLPQSYHKVPHLEDRLYVPPEFVALFVQVGWTTEGGAPVPGSTLPA